MKQTFANIDEDQVKTLLFFSQAFTSFLLFLFCEDSVAALLKVTYIKRVEVDSSAIIITDCYFTSFAPPYFGIL